MVLSNRAAVPQKQLLWGKLQFHGAKPLAMKEISERLCFPMSLACRNQAAICISFQKVCFTLWEVCQSSWKIMWSSRQNTMESLTSPVVRTISSNQRQPELPWQPHRRLKTMDIQRMQGPAPSPKLEILPQALDWKSKLHCCRIPYYFCCRILKMWSVVRSSHGKSLAWFQKSYIHHHSSTIYILFLAADVWGAVLSEEPFCALLYLFILAVLAKDPHMFNNSSATNTTSKRGRTF